MVYDVSTCAVLKGILLFGNIKTNLTERNKTFPYLSCIQIGKSAYLIKLEERLTHWTAILFNWEIFINKYLPVARGIVSVLVRAAFPFPLLGFKFPM